MSRDDRRRRRARRRRKHSRRRRLVVASVVTLALLAALSVKLELVLFAPQQEATCLALGDRSTTYKLTPEQAALATTIAATAKRMGLPNHAVTIGLATALQESGLRNLDHGDLDSLGAFQQRPSKGWGTPRQLQNPAYAAGAFFAVLAQLPNWQVLSVNDAAQAVQRSAHPLAYGKWETEGRALARDLTGEVAMGLSCRFKSVKTFLLDTVYKAMTDELGTTGAALGTSGPAGLNGWTVATWLVAHARQYSVHAISFSGYRWSVQAAAWKYTGGANRSVTFS